MSEQNIIEDLIELLSDTSYLSQVKDEETIKKIKTEKEKKYDQVVKQINMICELIEKELKAQLGYDIDSKKVRKSVITTIKNEVSNGNKIFKSDGKIDVGKLSDIVMQQKTKIKEQIIVENENDNEIVSKNNSEITNQNENTFLNKKDFKGRMKKLDLKLTDEEMDNLYDAVSLGDKIIEEFQEYIKSGLSESDAIKKICEGKTKEEIERIISSLGASIAVKIKEALQEEKNPEVIENLQDAQKKDALEREGISNTTNKVIEEVVGGENVRYETLDNLTEIVTSMNINNDSPKGEEILIAMNLEMNFREYYRGIENWNDAEKKSIPRLTDATDIPENTGASSVSYESLPTADCSKINDFQFDSYFGINSVDIKVEQKREEHKPTTFTVSEKEYDIPIMPQININEYEEENPRISNKEEFFGCLKQNNITNQDMISDIDELRGLSEDGQTHALSDNTDAKEDDESTSLDEQK